MCCFEDDRLILGDIEFTSRLLTGTGKFASRKLIAPMLEASGSQIITIALRRVDPGAGSENILSYIPESVTLLPNTSGARTADEAVRIARIARQAGCGNFIKIEVITDMQYLFPDNHETVLATQILAQEGFVVLPYIMPDLTTVRQLHDAGAAAVMPLGSPIGTNLGLEMQPMLRRIIEISRLPVIVDAGIGKPSHAACAMEMGADAVLVNTAIATSKDPVLAGRAFSRAVEAGRMAFRSKLGDQSGIARPSSPLTGFLREK
jgi:thiazole synthase